jgi:hypothetical protein
VWEPVALEKEIWLQAISVQTNMANGWIHGPKAQTLKNFLHARIPVERFFRARQIYPGGKAGPELTGPNQD